MRIEIATIDRFIDHIIGPKRSTPGVEIPALLAVWAEIKGYADEVSALDAVQRRLVQRGYLLS